MKENQVVITVEDDGAGIEPSLTQRAVEKGLISAEEAARLKGEEAYSLIFQSGFSTSSQVTEISGRGVGMDAVEALKRCTAPLWCKVCPAALPVLCCGCL